MLAIPFHDAVRLTVHTYRSYYIGYFIARNKSQYHYLYGFGEVIFGGSAQGSTTKSILYHITYLHQFRGPGSLGGKVGVKKRKRGTIELVVGRGVNNL